MRSVALHTYLSERGAEFAGPENDGQKDKKKWKRPAVH